MLSAQILISTKSGAASFLFIIHIILFFLLLYLFRIHLLYFIFTFIFPFIFENYDCFDLFEMCGSEKSTVKRCVEIFFSSHFYFQFFHFKKKKIVWLVKKDV